MAGGLVARRRAAILFLLLGFAAAPAAEASCQTPYCHHRYSLHARDRETELRRRMAADPTDAEAVERLLDLLGRKVDRERSLGEYDAALTWRAPPTLDELEHAVAEETRRLEELLTRLQAEDPRAWCRYATGLAEPEARLAALRRRLDEEPDQPELVSCLGRELARQERRDEAIAGLRSFLVAQPERHVALTLIDLLDDDEAAVLAVLEEQAARRPDDITTQLDLLRRYFRPRAREELRRRGEALTRRLLATPLSLADHRSLCSTVPSTNGEVYRGCLHQLLAAPFPTEDAEEVASARWSALRSLVTEAIHARAWDRLEPLLAAVPATELVSTWSQVIDHTRGDFCPQFLAAHRRGIEWQDEWQARNLVRALRRCGDEARARELAAAAGLLREDGSDATANEVAIDDLRRAPFVPFPPGVRHLPARRYVTSLVERAGPGLRAGLERWAREEPHELMPWLAIAALAERAGETEEAMTALQTAFASRPDDLDLQVALGAAALRLDRPEVARAAARWLRTDRTANARQRAEADYLLGRLARREGRWEEASELLAGYFLGRLRADGCRGVEACDRALVLHLVELGDQARLDDYLAARAQAVEVLLAPRPPWPPDQPCRVGRGPVCPRLLELDLAPLALDCVSPRALARLSALAEERPDDDALAARLAAARSRRVCTETELSDPETLFPDDQLLALSWSLREVD